jgi:hypothetical protein
MASTLDHVEKTLSDAYRKEIEQEENVWRSLPFFAGTLALQLAAMFQVIDRLPQRGSAGWWDSLGWIGIASIATLTALVFLAASIWIADFRYIMPEVDLLDYAEDLNDSERRMIDEGHEPPTDALSVFKEAIAREYANATTHNRLVNRSRALCRLVAGLATLASVFATLALVATVSLHYLFRGL